MSTIFPASVGADSAPISKATHVIKQIHSSPVASLMWLMSARTMSFCIFSGGLPNRRGGGFTYVRLSKRQKPNLPGA
jgi:hypothetical protein